MALLATIASWLAEALGLPYGIKVQNPRPLDAWAGPYDSVADAVATVPRRVRWPGMAVVVMVDGLPVRHVWKAGTGNNQLVPDGGLTTEQAAQLAVSGAVVRVTRAGAEDRGYSSLALARNTEYEVEEDLEGRLFLVQRATSVSTLVDLAQASGLVGQRTQVGVGAGGDLRLPVLVDGLSLRSFSPGIIRFPAVPCTAHNCFLYGVTIPAGSVLTVLDTEFSATYCDIAGTLIIGAGSGQRDLAAFLALYINNGDGTYSTVEGGTILDARGGSGGPADLSNYYTKEETDGLLEQAGGVDVRDIYDVPGPVREGVLAGTFSTSGATTGELQGAQPADSAAGMKFKAGQAKYEYMRGDAGTLVWVRSPVG